MMRKLLMTGFDPFAGESVNPSIRAVSRLEGDTIDGIQVVTREIPTVYGRAARIMRETIADHQPEIVISVGQSGGTHGIRLERLAINLDDAGIPDNEGNQPVDEEIAPGGPTAYWATIPCRAIVEDLRDAGIPAFLSYSAGTYLCNHVFYSVAHHVAEEGLPIRVGFIHVPFLPEQVVRKASPPRASMSEDTIVRALGRAVQTIANH